MIETNSNINVLFEHIPKDVGNINRDIAGFDMFFDDLCRESWEQVFN